MRIKGNSVFMKMLKRIPILSYVKGNFFQNKTGKRNSTFFTHKNNIKDSAELEFIKINKKHTLYKDRLEELLSFFEVSKFDIFLHYLRNGTPNTNYYKKRLLAKFDNYGTSIEKLKTAYDRASFMYTNRLMLRYHNFTIGHKLLLILQQLNRMEISDCQLLDYGCGVADPSILLAYYGAGVTIVDLQDKKFEFAKFRFIQRGLPFKSHGVTQTEHPIETSQTYHGIFMAEFIEHVRNPKEFLDFAFSHLKENGIFYDSLGPYHNHSVGGDHLEETKKYMQDSDYKSAFHSYFQPVNEVLNTEEFNHYYIKKYIS